MEGDVEKNSKGSEKYRKLERTGGERTRKGLCPHCLSGGAIGVLCYPDCSVQIAR